MDQYRYTFNMEQIGRRISELRKKQNMTQMGLADKLGISFQAVSNWERGNTMPDIGKLPELAQIFNVTTDELLGEASGLLHSAAKGELGQYMEENPVTMEELVQVAPVLLPEQTEEGVEKLTRDKPLPSLREIEDIIPFIGRDLVDELALKYADSAEYKNLDDLAPFASRQVLEQIADKWVDQGKSIDDLAPFLSSERIGELAFRYETASDWGHLEDCLPFLARETVVRLAKGAYEKNGIQKVEDFLPFLPQGFIQEIARREYDKSGMYGLEDLAPFLDRGFLTGLAKQALEKDGIKAISPIAPFLDREMLTQFIREKYI